MTQSESAGGLTVSGGLDVGGGSVGLGVLVSGGLVVAGGLLVAGGSVGLGVFVAGGVVVAGGSWDTGGGDSGVVDGLGVWDGSADTGGGVVSGGVLGSGDSGTVTDGVGVVLSIGEGSLVLGQHAKQSASTNTTRSRAQIHLREVFMTLQLLLKVRIYGGAVCLFYN